MAGLLHDCTSERCLLGAETIDIACWGEKDSKFLSATKSIAQKLYVFLSGLNRVKIMNDTSNAAKRFMQYSMHVVQKVKHFYPGA